MKEHRHIQPSWPAQSVIAVQVTKICKLFGYHTVQPAPQSFPQPFLMIHSYKSVGKISCIDATPELDLLLVGGREFLKLIELNPQQIHQNGYAFGTERFLKPKINGLKISINELSLNKTEKNSMLASTTNSELALFNINRKGLNIELVSSRKTNSNVSCLDWMPGHDNLAAAGTVQSQILLMDVRRGLSVEQSIAGKYLENSIKSIKFSFDNHFLAVSYQSGQINIHDVRALSKGPVYHQVGHCQACTLAWNPKKYYSLASASINTQIKLWDINEGKLQERQKLNHFSGVSSIKWMKSRYSSLGVVGATLKIVDDTINFYDFNQKYRPLLVFQGHKNFVKNYLMEMRDRYILSYDNDNYILLQSFNNGYRPYDDCPRDNCCFGINNQLILNIVQQSKLNSSLNRYSKNSIELSQKENQEMFVCIQRQSALKNQVIAIYQGIQREGKLADICKSNSKLYFSLKKPQLGQLWLNVSSYLQESVPRLKHKTQVRVLDVVDYFTNHKKIEQAVTSQKLVCLQKQISIQKKLYNQILKMQSQKEQGLSKEVELAYQKLTMDKLQQLVDQGELQSAIQIFIAIEKELDDQVVKNYDLQAWFFSFIEILFKMELYNYVSIVSAVSSKYSKPGKLNFQMKLICATCNNSISGTYCKHCVKFIACVICTNELDGITYWCSICGHTCHLKQAKEWFKTQRKCPEPYCNHQCQLMKHALS